MANEIDDLKERLRGGRKKAQPELAKGLSTGSTLMNMAFSGQPDWGLLPGYYYLFVGDSNSGKTFFTMAMLAEASVNSAFDKHVLVFDAAERGALMDIEKFFGHKLLGRLRPPRTDRHGLAVYSDTIESFFYHIDDLIKGGKPFVYILDSQDALECEEDQKKFQERKKASRDGRETAGSYGTGKPRFASSAVRGLINGLADTKSIVIIISQTRENIGFLAQRKPKTRSGGNALSFYATVEAWTSIREKIKGRILGKDRQLGIKSRVSVVRSRFTGRERTVLVPIYYSTGVDDLGSCIDYLVEEGHWQKSSKDLVAGEFSFRGTPEKLIEKIETEGREGELRQLVAKVWDGIEAACEVKRKRRYD